MKVSIEELQQLAGIFQPVVAEPSAIEGMHPDDCGCDECSCGDCGCADSHEVDANLPDMRSIIDSLGMEPVEEEVEDEWSNSSPEFDGEPRELEQAPGETVDISLRRHLGADPQHVKVEEDYTDGQLMDAYEEYKKNPLSEGMVAGSTIAHRDPEGKYIVVFTRAKNGFKILGKGEFRGEFTHTGLFRELESAVEHAELVTDGLEEDYMVEDAGADAYIDMLKSMDWNYKYSDSFDVYTRGEHAIRQLHKMKKSVDADSTIWNQYAPDHFKMGADTSAPAEVTAPQSDTGRIASNKARIDTAMAGMKKQFPREGLGEEITVECAACGDKGCKKCDGDKLDEFIDFDRMAKSTKKATKGGVISGDEFGMKGRKKSVKKNAKVKEDVFNQDLLGPADINKGKIYTYHDPTDAEQPELVKITDIEGERTMGFEISTINKSGVDNHLSLDEDDYVFEPREKAEAAVTEVRKSAGGAKQRRRSGVGESNVNGSAQKR